MPIRSPLRTRRAKRSPTLVAVIRVAADGGHRVEQRRGRHLGSPHGRPRGRDLASTGAAVLRRVCWALPARNGSPKHPRLGMREPFRVEFSDSPVGHCVRVADVIDEMSPGLGIRNPGHPGDRLGLVFNLA